MDGRAPKMVLHAQKIMIYQGLYSSFQTEPLEHQKKKKKKKETL